MRVGAIQSSYIPWRGYFDFIASVDIFVVYDDIQYSKNSWRNRNKIKTPRGTEWLTVPVVHKELSQLVVDTAIHNDGSWQKKHLGAWLGNYKAAPYYQIAMDILEPSVNSDYTTISQLNICLIRSICNYLEIETQLVLSSDLKLQGSKTDRLIDLLNKLSANTYLSGPSADAYLDKDLFRNNGFRLEYKSYDYCSYPQLWGGFIGAVTILDLIANCGPNSKHQIKSRQPNVVICP